jgi:hypothetical protein
VNLAPPVLLTSNNAASLGIPNPFPQQLGRLVFPPTRLSSQFDNVHQWENHASSVHEGLSLSLNRRLSNDIEFSSSYTLSKAIDDASDFNEQPENPYTLHVERALSLTISGIGSYSAGLLTCRSEMIRTARSPLE